MSTPNSRQRHFLSTDEVPAFLAASRAAETKIITARDAGNIDLIAGKIASAAAGNGWHDRYRELVDAGDAEGLREFIITKVMLIVSELAEAVEELRAGRGLDEVCYLGGGKPEGFPVELADARIRLDDLMGMLHLETGAIVREKLAYNESRGHKHGGKTV